MISYSKTLFKTNLQSLYRLPINIILTAIVALFAFSQVHAQQTYGNYGCIDTMAQYFQKRCTDPYQPVCGCNGHTYRNVCDASNNGVTSYVSGACDQIDLYFAPNPVQDVLHMNVWMKQPGDIHVFVFDLYGQLKYFQIFTISDVTFPFLKDIDMTAFPTLPYVIVLQSGNNIVRREFLKVPN